MRASGKHNIFYFLFDESNKFNNESTRIQYSIYRITPPPKKRTVNCKISFFTDTPIIYCAFYAMFESHK